MENVLFLQSEIKDPYAFYSSMRDQYEVYYDEKNNIQALYTYKACEQILCSPYAKISAPYSHINKHRELQNILDNLARLSNNAHHIEARAAAMHLMSYWRNYDVLSLLHSLIGEPRLPAKIDWVSEISKRLPAFALLRGFGFSTQNSLSLLSEIEHLVKLMAPVDNDEEIESILKSVRRVQASFDAHFLQKLPDVSGYDLYLANFIGLLIQSYDASSGLLSNGLLSFVTFRDLRPGNQEEFFAFVRESARLVPAVHNTRRTIQRDIQVGDHKIYEGDQVLVVLASANRDAKKFSNADTFIPDRANDSLSFGTGVHKCIADNFSIQLTASLLYYMNTKYTTFEISESEIQYEPRINVRLPKKITLIIS